MTLRDSEISQACANRTGLNSCDLRKRCGGRAGSCSTGRCTVGYARSQRGSVSTADYTDAGRSCGGEYDAASTATPRPVTIGQAEGLRVPSVATSAALRLQRESADTA